MEEHRQREDQQLRKKKKSKKRSGKDDNTVEGRDDEERRLKMLRKQAKRVVEHFAALGLDEFGQPLDNFSLLKYPVREWKFTLPGVETPIAINPVVAVIGGLLPWVCVLFGILFPTSMSTSFLEFRATISMAFVWFLQGSKALIFFFLLFVMFKYGHIHLGEKHVKPEFSTLSYFSMLFTAFVGAEFLVYCVQEPLAHQSSHFFAQAGYRSQDEIDMFAINMAVSNWGIMYWAHYTLIAVCMALAAHRFNLPLIFRSCFYPILGAYTWGWMGDFMDGFVNYVMIGGSASLLVMTARQLVAGFVHLGWIDSRSTQDELNSFTNVTLWLIIFTSSASVISGLQVGIRFMSNAAMSVGLVLLVLVLFLDDTKYLLNLCVQEVGYFLQTSVIQLNFWTDAFGQLRAGSGRAIDGKAAEDWWVDAWIIFTLSWCFVNALGLGVFAAAISRGRKLWEVCFYGLLAPTAYCLVSYVIFGGVGLRQSRQALELNALGTEYFNNSGHFLVDGQELCFDVPQEDIVVDGEVVFTNYLPGVSPVCTVDPEADGNTAIFGVVDSFHLPKQFGGGSLGAFLSILFLLSIALFFVTGSDAATLVADSLASNGRKNYHWSRRMYWACTTGAIATTLVLSNEKVLEAFDATFYVCSLPVAILVCYLLQSVTLMCQLADRMKDDVADYEFPDQPEFGMPVYGGIFNVMEYMVSLGKVNSARVDLCMDRATTNQVVEFLKGLFVPGLSLHNVLSTTYPSNQKSNMAVAATYAVLYYAWVVFFLSSGFHGVTCTLFLLAGLVLGAVRADFRQRYNLRSNTMGDFVAGMFFWPQVISQMRLQPTSPDSKADEPKPLVRCDTGEIDDYNGGKSIEL